MCKNIKKLHKMLKVGAAIICSALCLGSCSEDIDESNLYTFTGETILDYLSNREDFSNFRYIVERAGIKSQMSSYGSYTCFAPTNAAVIEYIDSLYDDTQNVEIPHNGMTEKSLEGLTDSLCRDIALFHFVYSEVMGLNLSSNDSKASNTVTLRSILGRDLNTSIDPVTGDIVINSYSHITKMDNELENGVLHEINHVIRRSNALIAGEMLKHEDMSIFNEALAKTGLADSLVLRYKLNSKGEEIEYEVKGTTMYYPKKCEVGYTVFVETDDALQANGINTFTDLVEKANSLYEHCADPGSGWYDYARNNNIQISTGSDYENPWNCLNMFIRYHILKLKASYGKLLYSGLNEVSKVTPYEYYETMLPYTLMKIERINGVMVINPWRLNNTLTDQVAEMMSNRVVKNPGIEVVNASINPLNGYIHPIKGIIAYDYDVPHGVLNERLRFDACSFLGEMMSNGLRCAKYNEIKNLNNGKLGTFGRHKDVNYVHFPTTFFDNMRVYNGDNTILLYLSGENSGWSNYQEDEFNCNGAYDFAFRLPPIPDGTYELRIGYTAEDMRGMLQFYLGSSPELSSMVALDIPLDMRHISELNADGSPDPSNGWCDWEKTDDKGVESDAAMRNKNWMRGPLYYSVGRGASLTGRGNRKDLRRIITKRTFHQGDYWLRCKTVLPDMITAEFHLDYIEIVPEHVYNNTQYVEDMY